MSSRYKPGLSWLPHHLTFTVIHWIDVFTRESYKELVVESLKYCIEHKGLSLHAWVVMPNHIHLIASMQQDFHMSDFVRDFKKYTSKKITTAIAENTTESRREWMIRAFAKAGSTNSSNDQFQFWQHDYHPIELERREMLTQRMNYLHQNPVKAGLVWEPQHYKYSSAIDYYEDILGLLPLVKLDCNLSQSQTGNHQIDTRALC